MRFFLIGFMGSGKTFWGGKLAEKFGMPFIDLDAYISRSEGKSIAALFQEDGQDTFRNLENTYLKKLIAEKEPFIMATGGGTPCFQGNMDLMNEAGITLYLRCPAELLFSRLKNEKADRPLLSGLSDEQLMEFIGEMLEIRKGDYEKSRHILDMDHADEFTFGQILENYV